MIRQGLCALLVGLTLVGGAPTAGARPPVPAKKTDEQLREAALKLNDLTDLKSMQARLVELNKDKDEAKRLVKLAAAMQKDGDEKSPPLKYNAAIVLGKLASNVKEYASAEYLYEGAFTRAVKLKSADKLTMAFDGIMQVYGEQKKYATQEEFAKKFLELDGEEGDEKLVVAKVLAQESIVKAKAKQGDTDGALKLAEEMVRDYKGWYFVQLQGWVQREAGKFGDAVDSYNKSIEKLEKDDGIDDKAREGIIKRTRYIVSGLYIDMKEVDKSADILKALIKDEPDTATYYNDLGFIWADAGKNLDEAEKMIRKAIELDAAERKKLLDEGAISEEVAKQENAAYVDSLGWVLYKAGKYEEAMKLLLQASKDPEEGNHIEIWDHVADCQVALGQTKEAVETWTKALKLADVSQRDTERRKKVTEKLKKAKMAK